MIRFMPVVLALASAPALAQSFNIDWGSGDHVPADTYGGVGLAGVWNNFESMPTLERLPLVGLDGAPIAADIMNIGFDVVESADLPGPSGDDAALLDDCFTSFNDPIDGCLFIRFMEPGEYRVILYAVAPDDPLLRSRLRIDQNAEDPVEVGGAWPGSHQPGVTYMQQVATVGADGRLDFHSGLPGANIRSVLSAMQVVRVEACVADLAEPVGVLDFSDVVAFLGAFAAGAPEADLAEPVGAFDFSDVVAFLGAFAAGCP
ncbi:MAG: GC-type dockerin domain-anchored protein [Phycisphaerales bacterium JB059]